MKHVVQNTKIKINIPMLDAVVKEAEIEFKSLHDPMRRTPEGRSAFACYNNMQHMYNRILSVNPFASSSDFAVIDVEGTVDLDSCARVYYKPSFTSLPASFRKVIEPLDSNNQFLFFDIKAAEFILACYFAGEQQILEDYNNGLDVYERLSKYFPSGTPRKQYKTAIISSLYGGTAYSTSKRLGITEAEADRIHSCIPAALPLLEVFKNKVKKLARSSGHYSYPLNFGCTEFAHVPFKPLTKKKSDTVPVYKDNLAVSVFVQSALGNFIQNFIHFLESNPLTNKGTILTVFDSILVEISPSDFDAVCELLQNNLSNFKVDKFKLGKTFYEAYA